MEFVIKNRADILYQKHRLMFFLYQELKKNGINSKTAR